MPVEIIEVIRRSTQGFTEPFICRGDNGKIYFVKGKGAGRRSLVAEWIAGHLGIELGIPIAPFDLVFIPEELLLAGSLLDLSDLGSGYAFGSQECSVSELTYSRIEQVPVVVQQKVLAFDWWIHNEDRTLSALGGNPNLFWDESNKQLVVIDHNQAFDRNFDPVSFASTHVFGKQWDAITESDDFRAAMSQQMQLALGKWSNIVQSIPVAWWYLDDEQTVSAQIDSQHIYNHLNRVTGKDFWRLP